jgi:hypothetical protein
MRRPTLTDRDNIKVTVLSGGPFGSPKRSETTLGEFRAQARQARQKDKD